MRGYDFRRVSCEFSASLPGRRVLVVQAGQMLQGQQINLYCGQSQIKIYVRIFLKDQRFKSNLNINVSTSQQYSISLVVITSNSAILLKIYTI